jgi:ABC-2 type transport system ATP-binding protein
MATLTASLRCQGLVKRFAETTAVDHLDLTVPTGTIFGLLGPNGSGKTSTIRTALGIYVPDGGSVELLGSRDPLAVRHRIGYLPEERGLYAKMKVIEQLAFLASIRGLEQKESLRRANSWLDRVELADSAQSLTSDLSKGMQQKVQFASAVIHDPDFVVLDEPFTGLDPVNTRLLKELILEQRDRGATVVLSTHRMEQVEALCESICLIHRGRPVLGGVLADIKAGYGRNTLALEYQGNAGALTDVPGVRHCEDTGQEARLELEPDTDAQSVIRALLDRVAVQAVRLEHPHIEEIYLEKVGHRNAPPAEATS